MGVLEDDLEESFEEVPVLPIGWNFGMDGTSFQKVTAWQNINANHISYYLYSKYLRFQQS